MKKGTPIPIYDATKDGNVFAWIHKAAAKYREAKSRDRDATLKKLAETRALQK